jgi:hypothetical protein
MEQVKSIVQQFPELIYCVAIMLLTYLILGLCVKGHPSNRTAKLVCLGVGIILGVLAGIFLQPNWWYMGLGYLAAPTLYDYTIKWMMKRLGYNYGGKINDDLYNDTK